MASKYFNAPNPTVRRPKAGADFNEKPTPPEGGRPRIFVAVPAHDGRFHSMFAMSVFGLVSSNKYLLALSKIAHGGITKARNDGVHGFLESGFEYLLFADSDLQFDYTNIDKLLAANKDIVCAMYPHKKLDLAWSAHFFPGVEGGEPEGDLQQVAAMGMGLALIKRNVFLEMQKKLPEIGHRETWSHGKGQWKYGYFQERVLIDAEAGHPEPTWFTEDFFFCYMARKCGFKIYTDTSFYLRHHDGAQQFPSETIMDASDALMNYAEGLQDEGKLAKEVMTKRLPGWAQNWMRPVAGPKEVTPV